MKFSTITLFPLLDQQQSIEVQEEIIPEPLVDRALENLVAPAFSSNGDGLSVVLEDGSSSPAAWDEAGLDGELVVDVYETDTHVIVIAPIAGARADDLDITVVNDLLTIRGSRIHDAQREALRPIYQECHWGAFSRSIILPSEVQSDRVKAFLKQGILTILLPKFSAKKVRVEDFDFE